MDRLQMALYVFSIKATIDLSLVLLSQGTAYFSKLQSARPKDREGLEDFFWGFTPKAFFLVRFLFRRTGIFKEVTISSASGEVGTC